ncbi:MAG: class I SAM-dependent methyltransferase [Dehalococcoidia bacterium]|nr:class I SAM-dependent methyltransferase [Dehalococcoidia bacterium]
MTVLAAVQEQYETFPYPPRDPERELEKLHTTLMSQLKVANIAIWGGRRRVDAAFRALDAGCGTGDNAIFLAEQVRHAGGHVVAVDLSAASLDIARQRAAKRGIENITFVQAPLEELPHLGLGTFDYAVSTGVLHHLASPEAGLAAIRDVLTPDGGMGLMVYGLYGRTAIYQLQELLRIVAPPSLPTAERVRIAREVLAGLRPDHWASYGRSTWAGEIELFGDAGLFDAFLHSTDRAYTVPQVYEWLAGAGLSLAAFGMPTFYRPELYGSSVDYSTLPEPQRHAAAELLNGKLQTHSFYVSRGPVAPAPSPLDETATPDWLQYDSSLARAQVEGRPELRLNFEGLDFQMTLDPVRRALLKLVDGRRPLAAIIDAVAAKYPKQPREAILRAWQETHDGLAMFRMMGMFAPA